MADRLKVAVLGCGPAGLLAAHGASMAARPSAEVEVKIFSVKKKSPLFGCQYLHRPIPGLSDGLECQRVRYELRGRKDVYRRKVYGENEDVLTSVEALERDHYAWNIRHAYDRLWRKFEPCIEDTSLSHDAWGKLRPELLEDGYRLMISTLPSPALCSDLAGCTFRSESVWAMGDAPELGRWAATPIELEDGRILCSGEERDPWYRVSRVFGHHTVEWPDEVAPPRGASRVTKPISTTCKCNPELVRSGRYARWRKGVLAHESYEDGYRLTRRALRG